MVIGVDHIDIRVSDVDAFIEHFGKLGFKVLDRLIRPDRDKAQLALPGENQVILDISKATEEEPYLGVKHIGLAISSPDDVEILMAAGINISKAHRKSGSSERLLTNFTDIDGKVWQLVE